MKKFALLLLVLSVSTNSLAQKAPAKKPASSATQAMDVLLQQIKNGLKAEQQKHQDREQRFLNDRNKQKALLEKAEAKQQALEKRSENLEREFEGNETRIAELEQTLQNRLGTLGELFGVVRQMAGETLGDLDGSLITAQLPGRTAPLETLAQSKKLPSIGELQQLWYLLQQEIIESGKVVRFKAPVIMTQGQEKEALVTRVGPFNAVANGKFLRWLSGEGKLAELGRQPPARHVATVSHLEKDKDPWIRFSIDPSRGSILSLLVQTPSFSERLKFGGLIGYIIIGLGLLTLLFGLIRLIFLQMTNRKIGRQQTQTQTSDQNPLGRILNVYTQNPNVDVDTLERKLDEAILNETGRLERFMWAIKVVSVVAPLMGLLGTVTGMIRTFQAITLFGTGDPKLMASGISEALVTTMLGLIVAIPLVLLHSYMSNIIKGIRNILEEQSAGFIARKSEEN